MNKLKLTKRRPDSVGVILREEFLESYGLTQDRLAKAMGVTRTVVNELVNDRRGVTVDTAIMLGKVFNNSPKFWLNIQIDNNLWLAMHDTRKLAKFSRIVSLKRLTADAGA